MPRKDAPEVFCLDLAGEDAPQSKSEALLLRLVLIRLLVHVLSSQPPALFPHRPHQPHADLSDALERV